MNDKKADIISKSLDTVKRPCTNQCKYYQEAFNHRDRACILSDVYSV